jgi:hypothetical protein
MQTKTFKSIQDVSGITDPESPKLMFDMSSVRPEKVSASSYIKNKFRYIYSPTATKNTQAKTAVTWQEELAAIYEPYIKKTEPPATAAASCFFSVDG